MPAAFLWLTPFIAALFEWLRRLSACGVSMAKAVYRCAVSVATPFEWLRPFIAALFLWLRCLNGCAVSKFYVVCDEKKYINICSSENYVYFCGIVMAITVMLFTEK